MVYILYSITTTGQYQFGPLAHDRTRPLYWKRQHTRPRMWLQHSGNIWTADCQVVFPPDATFESMDRKCWSGLRMGWQAVQCTSA